MRRDSPVRRAGARFSKVPKLYGPFSGVTIPFVSQERRVFKSSDFTVIFFSSRQTGLNRLPENFSARLAEISASQSGISAIVSARLLI